MEWVYKGQTGVIIDCEIQGTDIDFSDIGEIFFKANDPDGVPYTLGTAGIYDEDDQIIRADLGTSFYFDTVGIWKIWPFFVMLDNRSIPGKPDEIKVLEEGDSPPN